MESQQPRPGLTSVQVRQKLDEFGENSIPERRQSSVLQFLKRFWSPVPWMLEATLILELIVGKFLQGAIIAGLLVLNATLSFLQERRASSALALLRRRLTIMVRVLRDSRWQILPSQELVPGDVIRIRVGDFIPADIRVLEGQILVDQSALTGESTLQDIEVAAPAYAGSVVRRGEATGQVTATGQKTKFGKTAELVSNATSPSRLTLLIFTIVKHLVSIDLILVAIILGYAISGGISFTETIPFALILLVASVPVALPATYTLASALGALELAERGVLVTRLSAIEEAAEMDVLCCDKTGTLTRNQLDVASVQAYSPYEQEDVIRWAAMASEISTQDPIDLAIVQAAQRLNVPDSSVQRLQFRPFDPATKRSEAVIVRENQTLLVVKGAPQIIGSLIADSQIDPKDVDRLAGSGCRVLAVAAGPENSLKLVGLIGLSDPPRQDSTAALRELHNLGVRVVMVTGDSRETALAIAGQVGIAGTVCPAEAVHRDEISENLDCSLFAGVYPEDKFRLVQAFQKSGHVVGMTGDGVNDSPALKQAEVGVAVSNATDVAKSAASLVLTRPGLSDIQAAIETGRRIHQRMLTYTLNKIVKTIQIALLLSLGLLLTGLFVTTPLLILLLLFANDFVTMSLAQDRVTFSRKPDRWRISSLTIGAGIIAAAWLILTFSLFLWGRESGQLELAQLQTLVFVVLVFTGQATVYLVRERRHFWCSVPGFWLLVTSTTAILVVSVMACRGVLMAPIGADIVVGVLVIVGACSVLMDFVKIRVFQRCGLRSD